jgi:hypothetical protein
MFCYDLTMSLFKCTICGEEFEWGTSHEHKFTDEEKELRKKDAMKMAKLLYDIHQDNK